MSAPGLSQNSEQGGGLGNAIANLVAMLLQAFAPMLQMAAQVKPDTGNLHASGTTLPPPGDMGEYGRWSGRGNNLNYVGLKLSPLPITGGEVVQMQGTRAAVRNQQISGNLENVLAQAAAHVKAYTGTSVRAVVFSGGQDEAGAHHTGSDRHNHGDAADCNIQVYEGGRWRTLSMNNQRDQGMMAEFISWSVAYGAMGVGAAEDYMGPTAVHIGFGKPGTWGAGGHSSAAPGWLIEAWKQGMLRQREAGTNFPMPQGGTRNPSYKYGI